ncbi:unnamed protein product [Brassica rapa subsp. narinosa]
MVFSQHLFEALTRKYRTQANRPPSRSSPELLPAMITSFHRRSTWSRHL